MKRYIFVMNNLPELSGWLILKLALRCLGSVMLAVGKIAIPPSVKRSRGAVRYLAVCGNWTLRFTIKPSARSRSRSPRSGTMPSGGLSSSSTETTQPETDQLAVVVSSYQDVPASELLPSQQQV